MEQKQLITEIMNEDQKDGLYALDREMKDLEVHINSIHFVEIPYPEYVIYGDEDKFPFLDSNVYGGVNPHAPTSAVHSPIHRVYKSIQINGKFYAPIPKGGNK